MSASRPDLEALLVALVLAPATYSRNRFFDLYSDPAAKRVRRRAALVRSIVRHLVSTGAKAHGEPARIAAAEGEDGRFELSYGVPALGLRRTTSLDPVEAALVRFALARAQRRDDGSEVPLAGDDPDRLRIESALRRLAPTAAPDHHAEDRHTRAPQEPIA